MKASGMMSILIAAVFSIGVALADEPRREEVIVVTAPKPQAIADSEIALPVAVKPVIDYTSLKIEPPKLDRSATGGEGRVDLALGEAEKTKS